MSEEKKVEERFKSMEQRKAEASALRKERFEYAVLNGMQLFVEEAQTLDEPTRRTVNAAILSLINRVLSIEAFLKSVSTPPQDKAVEVETVVSTEEKS